MRSKKPEYVVNAAGLTNVPIESGKGLRSERDVRAYLEKVGFQAIIVCRQHWAEIGKNNIFTFLTKVFS